MQIRSAGPCCIRKMLDVSAFTEHLVHLRRGSDRGSNCIVEGELPVATTCKRLLAGGKLLVSIEATGPSAMFMMVDDQPPLTYNGDV